MQIMNDVAAQALLAGPSVRYSAAVSVTKQAIEAQGQAVLTLIASVPQPVPAGSAGPLGQNVDTWA